MSGKKLLVICTLFLSINASAQVASGLQRGGSNFNWYNSVSCDHEPYGVVVNYNTQTTAITNEIALMQAAGQQKARIMLFFGQGLSSGTLMDSTGGVLSSQNISNLNGLLANLKNHGFAEIEIAFSPQGPNDPGQWSSLNTTMAAQNWSVINQVHRAVVNPGFNHIYYDLGNEMMTTSTSNARYNYMKYIWPKYWAAFGTFDSVGFSFASGQINAISNMASIYGTSHFPVMGDVHIYPYGTNTAGDILYAAAHNFKTIGPVAGSYRFVIGEANFNSDADAASMAAQLNALAANDSKPWYLMQWPSSASNPTCVVADVSPFNNYEAHGF